MVRLGQKVEFDALFCVKTSIERVEAPTVGTVVYINKRHNWFSVQYGENQRTSFKFTEIGQNVTICK